MVVFIIGLTAGIVTLTIRQRPTLEKAEATVAELEAQLADPEIYDRPEDVHQLATRHEEAKADAARLMDEWESAAEQLEA